MRVEPGKPRYQLEQLPAGASVTIPAARSPFAIVFLLVWLGGWTFGEITVAGQISRLLSDPSSLTRDPGQLFVIVWLCAWTVGGLAALMTILWQLVGREEVRIDAGVLSVRACLGPLARGREFDLFEVQRFRATPVTPEMSARRLGFYPFFGSGQGPLAFDYGARTYRFGAGLDEAEANALAAALTRLLPKSAVTPS